MPGISGEYSRQVANLLAVWVRDHKVVEVEMEEREDAPVPAPAPAKRRFARWMKSAAKRVRQAPKALKQRVAKKVRVKVAERVDRLVRERTGKRSGLLYRQDLQQWYQKQLQEAASPVARQIVQLKTLSQMRRNLGAQPLAHRVEELARNILESLRAQPEEQEALDEAERLCHFIRYPMAAVMTPREVGARVFHQLPEIYRLLLVDKVPLPNFLAGAGMKFAQKLFPAHPHDIEEKQQLDSALQKLHDPYADPLTERELSALVENLQQQFLGDKDQIFRWVAGAASYLSLHHPELLSHLPKMVRVALRVRQQGRRADVLRLKVLKLHKIVEEIDRQLGEADPTKQRALKKQREKLQREIKSLRQQAVRLEKEDAKQPFGMTEKERQLVEFAEFAAALFAASYQRVGAPPTEHAKEQDSWTALLDQVEAILPIATKTFGITKEEEEPFSYLLDPESMTPEERERLLGERISGVIQQAEGLKEEHKALLIEVLPAFTLYALEHHAVDLLEVGAKLAASALQSPLGENPREWVVENLGKHAAPTLIGLLQSQRREGSRIPGHVRSILTWAKTAQLTESQRQLLAQVAPTLVAHLAEHHVVDLAGLALTIALSAQQEPPGEELQEWGMRHIAPPLFHKLLALLRGERGDLSEITSQVEELVQGVEGLAGWQKDLLKRVAPKMTQHLIDKQATSLVEIALDVVAEALPSAPEGDPRGWIQDKKWIVEQIAGPFAKKMAMILREEGPLLIAQVKEITENMEGLTDWQRAFLQHLSPVLLEDILQNHSSTLIDFSVDLAMRALEDSPTGNPKLWIFKHVVKPFIERQSVAKGLLIALFGVTIALLIGLPLLLIFYLRPDWAAKAAAHSASFALSRAKGEEGVEEEISLPVWMELGQERSEEPFAGRERLAELARRGVSTELTERVNAALEGAGEGRVAVLIQMLQEHSLKVAGISTDQIEVFLRIPAQ